MSLRLSSAPARANPGVETAWLAAALLVFCGFPLLLIVSVVLNIAGGFEDGGAAARDEDATKVIVRQLGQYHSRSQEATHANMVYLASTSESLARAELQDLTTRLTERAAGRLIEAQIVEAQIVEGRMPATVTIELTIDITNAALLDLLYNAETNLPLLNIRSLDTRAAEAGGDSPAGTLHTSLTIEAYWRKGTP